ncbi:hypothetical protein ACSBLW_04560 [Thioclava sp. FR2]|uniref:hypothetical protein n=1 Tax=Thioclava sp. FR2 TaxID=3445780 RepID=UPI003EB73BBF
MAANEKERAMAKEDRHHEDGSFGQDFPRFLNRRAALGGLAAAGGAATLAWVW